MPYDTCKFIGVFLVIAVYVNPNLMNALSYVLMFSREGRVPDRRQTLGMHSSKSFSVSAFGAKKCQESQNTQHKHGCCGLGMRTLVCLQGADDPLNFVLC